MTIDEYKAYMEERDAKNLAIFEEYMIESGYANLPGTTTEIKDLLEEIKNDKQEPIDYSNQFNRIISLLKEIKNLDPSSPDYSAILKEISEKITEWKCNCECGKDSSNNEGILGDLENALG